MFSPNISHGFNKSGSGREMKNGLFFAMLFDLEF